MAGQVTHRITTFPRKAEAAALDTEYDYESVIWVNGTGNVSCRPAGSAADVTFTVTAGNPVPVMVSRVNTSGTTATGLVRIW